MKKFTYRLIAIAILALGSYQVQAATSGQIHLKGEVEATQSIIVTPYGKYNKLDMDDLTNQQVGEYKVYNPASTCQIRFTSGHQSGDYGYLTLNTTDKVAYELHPHTSFTDNLFVVKNRSCPPHNGGYSLYVQLKTKATMPGVYEDTITITISE
jgi:hypothetical protein